MLTVRRRSIRCRPPTCWPINPAPSSGKGPGRRRPIPFQSRPHLAAMYQRHNRPVKPSANRRSLTNCYQTAGFNHAFVPSSPISTMIESDPVGASTTGPVLAANRIVQTVAAAALVPAILAGQVGPAGPSWHYRRRFRFDHVQGRPAENGPSWGRLDAAVGKFRLGRRLGNGKTENRQRKRESVNYRIPLIYLVAGPGFEPGTFGL